MQFSKLVESYEKLEGVSGRLKMIELLTEALKESGKGEISKIVYMTQGTLLPPFEGLEFGIAEKIVEEAIAVATGFTKEQVDRDFKRSGDLGITAQKLREESKLKSMRQARNSVSDVYDTMKKLAEASGQGSKDTKITMLANMFASSSPVEAKYIARYPLGQLRLGVGDATILEALSSMATGGREAKPELESAYNICSDLGAVAEELVSGGMEAIGAMHVTVFKPIRPALAERLPTAEEIIERMNGTAAVEHKYDGFRLQVHKSGKKVRLFSRRLEDVTAMFPDIIEATLSEVHEDRIIFEGEAIAYNEATQEFLPFQETIQRKRKHGVKEKALELPLHLFAFDMMYLGGRDWLREPYKKRRAELERILAKGKRIVPTTKIVTSSPKELETFFEEAIAEGLEGIMTKDLEAPYIAGARKFSWIKLKRSYKGELSDTVDLVIVGYFLGRGSRAEFKFGGLLGAVYNKKRDMFETVSRIGSGFTEKQMTELEELLDKIKVKARPARVDAIVEPDFWVYPKYVVTVMADEITKSPTHTCGREKQADGTEVGYALRFPRLVGETAVREDKSLEDATTTKEIIEMYGKQKKVGVKES
ncbi:MAG TPA: ATP-dependent DNA ligase [Candidatus Acidoferrales bacterium]|nr:ATP-dependent DNA ligase [Candidatus Acidoferrales bacterium]